MNNSPQTVLDIIYRGFVVKPPHGDYLVSGKKKIITKSKKYSDIMNKPLLVIQNKKALGIIIIDFVKTLTEKEFIKKRKLHLISEKEQKLWYTMRNYNEYKIKYKYWFKNPIPINYSIGPHTIVMPSNITIMQNIYIGTSGYDYNWFNTSSTNSLIYYASKFNSLELNSSFYKIPNDKQCLKLLNNTPKNFKFSIKIHKSITHFGKLNNKSVNYFIKKLKILILKIQCLLFQFSSKFKYSKKNFNKFKNLKHNKLKFAFEFRDASWYNNDVYELFKKRKNWTIVITYDYINKLNFDLSNFNFISNYIYIRLHGTTDKYEGSHIKLIPALIKFVRDSYINSISDVFIYFNNTNSYNKKISDALYDAQYTKKYIGF